MASEVQGARVIKKKRFGKTWDITFDEYRELAYFCYQYGKKKQQADDMLTLRVSTPQPVTDEKGNGAFMPHGKGGTSDPVSTMASRRDKLLRDVDMIERAAHIAGGDLYPWLLKCVTTRVKVETLVTECPASESTIYRMRRRFFFILKQIRDES